MKQVVISRFPPMEYAYKEAMNTLCTNLSYCGTNIRSILLTSRYAQEGKSSLAMYIMKTFASLGKRVVLVDTDLRRSNLTRRFGFQFEQKGALGLSQYLAGLCDLDSVVYQSNFPGVYIVPSGREVSNSLQLLASPRFKDLIERLEKEFDVVLVDSAPSGIIVDAVEIAKYCDGALLVVAFNKGRKQEIKDVADAISLTGCTVLGAVLNGVDMEDFRNRKYYYRTGRYSSRYYYQHYNASRKKVHKEKKV